MFLRLENIAMCVRINYSVISMHSTIYLKSWNQWGIDNDLLQPVCNLLCLDMLNCMKLEIQWLLSYYAIYIMQWMNVVVTKPIYRYDASSNDMYWFTLSRFTFLDKWCFKSHDSKPIWLIHIYDGQRLLGP